MRFHFHLDLQLSVDKTKTEKKNEIEENENEKWKKIEFARDLEMVRKKTALQDARSHSGTHTRNSQGKRHRKRLTHEFINRLSVLLPKKATNERTNGVDK